MIMEKDIMIEMCLASEYATSAYGITHESVRVFKVSGRGVHSPGHPHRFKVWTNDLHPRVDTAKYIDPQGNSTDQPITITLSAGVAIIAAHKLADQPVYSACELLIGNTVRLCYPDGRVSDPYVITAVPLANPVLVPADLT